MSSFIEKFFSFRAFFLKHLCMKQLCDRCPISVASACPIVVDGYYDDRGCPLCGSQELANCGYECKLRYCEGCGSNLFPKSSNSKVNEE